jgi:nickel-dependent lactate racemase
VSILVSVGVRYGQGEKTVHVPDHIPVRIFRKSDSHPISDPDSAVRACFHSPVGSDTLAGLAAEAKNACIAICDITRPVPNGLFLRPMIETMIRAGIPVDRITILVATGLHRPNLGSELDGLIGDPWVRQNVSIMNHDAHDDGQHVSLGYTKTRQTVVRLNRQFVDADLKIVTGLVEPHFMAGYSGGRKVIAPGIAHHETIRTFHSAKFMSDPCAANCNFVGNPLHEEQLQIVDMLGPVYAVNTVIDEQRRLNRINFGEVVTSHLEMVEAVRSDCELKVDKRFTTVLTSAAGYPLDQTYYQSIKGMVGAIEILEPGGDLIIASACSEGFGSAAFRDSQKQLIEYGPDALLERLMKKSFADVDEWQTQKQIAPMKKGVLHLCTDGLSPEEETLTGVNCCNDLQELLNHSLSRFERPSLAVIPEGPYVIPKWTME